MTDRPIPHLRAVTLDTDAPRAGLAERALELLCNYFRVSELPVLIEPLQLHGDEAASDRKWARIVFPATAARIEDLSGWKL